VARGFGHIDVGPEGIDLPDPVGSGPMQKAEVPTIAFCGRLVRSKRPDDLIDAFRRLQLDRPDAALVVIGRGPLRDRLEAASPPGVRFADDLDDAGKLREMARAHLLVATSVREGWGLVVSEAATVGTPTLAYDVPGLRDSAGASGGYLCPPDPESLAAHMAALLDRWEHHPPVVDPHGGARSWDDVADAVLHHVAEHAGLDARAPAPSVASPSAQAVETAS
jgi:glycosyltransferase involved in cell wall biosynthesis